MLTTMDLIEAMETPNNYRRMRGQKPKRWKHMWAARNKRIIKTQMDVNSLYPAFARFSVSLEGASEAFGKLTQAVKDFGGRVDENRTTC